MQRVSTRAWCVLYNMCMCRVKGTDGICVWRFWGSEIGYCSAQNKRGVGYERLSERKARIRKISKTGREKPHNQVVYMSSDKPPVVKPALATRLATLALGERVPEAEGLVPCARDNCPTIGTHREVEDATRMAGE